MNYAFDITENPGQASVQKAYEHQIFTMRQVLASLTNRLSYLKAFHKI